MEFFSLTNAMHNLDKTKSGIFYTWFLQIYTYDIYLYYVLCIVICYYQWGQWNCFDKLKNWI